MRTRPSWGYAAVLVAFAFVASPASGCLVAMPVPLKELLVPGSQVRETEMRVVSIIKGTASNVIEFRHYAPLGTSVLVMMCPPPSYTFVVGRTYIVLARRVAGDTYRQLSTSRTISRAQHFRESIRKSPIYIDSMFDSVQQNPTAYLP